MANLVEIKMQSMDILERFRGKEKTAELNKLTSRVGESIAQVARARMSRMIGKGGKYHIAASGRASQDFQVRLDTERTGMVKWVVAEMGNTPATSAIRKGIPAGQAPSIEALRLWVADKGLTLTYQVPKQWGPWDTKSAGTYQRVSGYTKKSGKQVQDYGKFKGEKDSRKKAEAILYKIQRKLYKEGTFRPGSNWYKNSPYPRGVGRFDYPAYTMKMGYAFQNEVNKYSIDGLSALVDWLSSGKRQGMGRTFSNFAELDE